MSKYKYKFSVATRYVGSKVEEVVDLVDDFGEKLSSLDSMDEEKLEALVDELYETWVWENIDGGIDPV